MKALKKLREIVTGQTAETKIEVEITEKCLVNGMERIPGERLNLSERDAGALFAAERARRVFTDAETAERDRLNRMIPPPWTPAPLPELWQSMPEPFHKLWEISERYRCAHGRAGEIEALYLRGRGMNDSERHQLEQETSRTAADGTTRSALIESWISERAKNVLRITVGEQRADELRKISDALNRAYQAINDLRDECGEDFTRLSVLCGDAVLDEVARGQRAARAASRDGFELFKHRLASLELGEAELRRLYRGTREQLAFEVQEPTPPNLRLGWADPETGEARHICPGTPGELASWFAMFRAKADELSAIAKQAAAELDRARGVTGTAGKSKTGKAA